MNILILYWGKKGGGARYTLEVARSLKKQTGVKTYLSISTYCEIFEEFTSLSIPIHVVKTYRSVFGFSYKFLIGKYLIKKGFERYLKENQIDTVIIGMDFFWSEVIYNACKKAGAKTIYVVHEPKPHPNEPAIMSFIKERTLRNAIRGADHVVTLTEHVSRFVQNKYGVPTGCVSVIPHGIFSYYSAPAHKKINGDVENLVLLFFGRIEYYKGLDILLKAFRLLRNSGFKIKLEIWGSGDLSDYECLLSNTDNIRIENRWISEDEIPTIFKRAHLCILPYRDASQSGIVGIANDAAIPIIACPSEGLREQLIGAGALLSDDFTPESLANVIEKVITDREKYEELSKKAIDYSSKLRWPSIAHSFKRLGEDLQNSNLGSGESMLPQKN